MAVSAGDLLSQGPHHNGLAGQHHTFAPLLAEEQLRNQAHFNSLYHERAHGGKSHFYSGMSWEVIKQLFLIWVLFGCC